MEINNATILILTFVITTILVTIIYYFLLLKKKKDKWKLINDLRHLEKANLINDIKGINHYGTKVFWNANLDSELLDKVSEIVDSKIKDSPELKGLKLLIYNKRLDWNKARPNF